MTLANCPAPTTAERIRSTCVRAGGALLAVEGAEPLTTPLHHLLGDGSFAVAVPVGGAVATQLVDCEPGAAQAVLELADYAPLPLREPVRSLVWVRGRLRQVPLPTVPGVLDGIAAEHPNPALLQVQTPGSAPVADQGADHTRYLLARLEIESVVVTDATGAEAVELGSLLAARPDPFCAFESCWIRHLDTAHRDVSPDWPPGCPRGCGAETSARWGWTVTVCGYASKAPTVTATSGCRSASRLTTSPVWVRPSGC
jgi:hypothetical protein